MKLLFMSGNIVDWSAKLLVDGFLLLANVRDCESLSAFSLSGVISSLTIDDSGLAFCAFLFTLRTVFVLPCPCWGASVC